jgi:hypothetical protein
MTDFTTLLQQETPGSSFLARCSLARFMDWNQDIQKR